MSEKFIRESIKKALLGKHDRASLIKALQDATAHLIPPPKIEVTSCEIKNGILYADVTITPISIVKEINL